MRRVLLVATTVIPAAWGCSDDSPVAPSEPVDNMVIITPSEPVGNVVIITSTGAEPLTIGINVGERVRFVNNDDVDRDMSSDPHPSHHLCPEINAVGYLLPGQARETANFVVPETCTYHDHLDAQNPTLNGTIVIVE